MVVTPIVFRYLFNILLLLLLLFVYLFLNVLFRAYNLILKRITRSAIIVEINTKDVKLVKTNISSLLSFWNVKTKY